MNGMSWVICFIFGWALCEALDWWFNRRKKKQRRERTAAERALDLIAADYAPRRGPKREKKKRH